MSSGESKNISSASGESHQISETSGRVYPGPKNRMYQGAKTWNPFRGCLYDCSYCVTSFKRQARRQRHICNLCYSFAPHFHPERLKALPNSEIIFVGGVGDLSFCRDEDIQQVIERVVEHDRKYGNRAYYLQSKAPVCFQPYLSLLSKGCVIVTTLETNRDQGYAAISKAPLPQERYRQFLALDYPRKVVTVEPVMDFDLDLFVEMIRTADPEYIWLGYNSHPKTVSLPEPDKEKLMAFKNAVESAGIPVKEKNLRA